MQTEDIKINGNELESQFMPNGLSISLTKDRWDWSYSCLDSENDFGLTFDNPIDALCHLASILLKTNSFRQEAENFRDALEQVIEHEPYDDGVMETLTQISELLDNTIQDL